MLSVPHSAQVLTLLGAKDPQFIYRVQADTEGRIKNLMCANGSSRLQYNFFGDVVTFDTTYRINFYDMPFGLLVGVNNHFQRVILASVLVRDEIAFQVGFRRFFEDDGNCRTKNNIDRTVPWRLR